MRAISPVYVCSIWVMLAIAVVCWSPDPHCRLPRKVSVETFRLRWCAPRASPLSLGCTPILWSKDPEDVTLISGAMRSDVVEDHACFIIFGTFSYRSPVILLGFGWDGYQQLWVALRVDIPLYVKYLRYFDHPPHFLSVDLYADEDLGPHQAFKSTRSPPSLALESHRHR